MESEAWQNHKQSAPNQLLKLQDKGTFQPPLSTGDLFYAKMIIFLWGCYANQCRADGNQNCSTLELIATEVQLALLYFIYKTYELPAVEAT